MARQIAQFYVDADWHPTVMLCIPVEVPTNTWDSYTSSLVL